MTDDSISRYDYVLPKALIATQPLAERDGSRLLTLDRPSGAMAHRRFRELPDLLRPDDLLILNQTRVVPARLVGLRTATAGRWEGLFLGTLAGGDWRLIGQTRGKLLPGETLTILATDRDAPDPPTLTLLLIERTDEGEWISRPSIDAAAFDLLDQFGTVPLPPYMERESPTAVDRQRYQTTYAQIPGAVAAPTAGLHFTPEILDRCRAKGVGTAFVTLHVGLGTFRPVSVKNLRDHVMHHEWCELPQATVEAIAETKARGGRIIAVGTTTVRTLESVAARGPLHAWSGETDLFIRPPYEFRVVDGLLTNFHLPQSTLLVLVSAFAGRERVFAAYEAAIAERYRFYSYGDAMFIV